jgi:hypothetical protein
MRFNFAAVMLAALQISQAVAKANVSCAATTSSQPSLHYTISPKFFWFPIAINAEGVTNILEHSLTEASRTAYTTGRTAKSTIRKFLNSPCTLHLTVSGSHMQPDSSTAFRLLNYTLGDTDLICRMATYKRGKTYTEVEHTMLSSHIRATIRPKSRGGPPPRIRLDERVEVEAETGRIEYTIDCPPTAGLTIADDKAINSFEGLKGLAQVRDCEWCLKAAGELQGICKPKEQGLDNLVTFVSEKQWAFGSAECETCK